MLSMESKPTVLLISVRELLSWAKVILYWGRISSVPAAGVWGAGAGAESTEKGRVRRKRRGMAVMVDRGDITWEWKKELEKWETSGSLKENERRKTTEISWNRSLRNHI